MLHMPAAVGWRASRILLALFAGLISQLAICSDAFAQAWLAPKGEAFYSFGYGNTFVKDHFYSDGNEGDRGHIRSNSLTMDLGYSVSDRLAVSFGIPYLISKYYGQFPHASGIDDGSYRGTFQDYRVEVRYGLFRGPFVATPFVAATIPSHSYITLAHSAAGRDLHEYRLGSYFGGRLEPILPNSYFQARYSYAFVERVLGIRHDRSNADLELGHFVSPSVAVRVFGSWAHDHGGYDIPPPYDVAAFNAFKNSIYAPVHDRISRESYLNLGGGASYALTGAVDVYASYLTSVWGRGFHKIKDGFNFGFVWSFSPQQLTRKFFAKRSPTLGPAIQ